MPPASFIYAPDYYCDLGGHVFRTEKYGLLHGKMLESGLAAEEDFLQPEPATRRQLALVHTQAYLDDLFSGRFTARTIRSEMPISRPIVDAFVLGAGGSIMACRVATAERTMALNLQGGFHHAFPDWAEGFCYINDVAVGTANALHEGWADRIMVVDCDLHQGNGTAYTFREEPAVFTFSIHEEDNYPVKRQSDLDIGLPSRCSGERYLGELRGHLGPALQEHCPGLVIYVAGADPYAGDQLGTLTLAPEELRARDDLVLGACAERDIPVAAVLAGGYAPDVNETVGIHYGTACSLVEHSRALGP